jgi:hypothetical protein
MVSVTIRIKPQQDTKDTDFDVHLIEEDDRRTAGVLRRTDLTTGPWTANVDGVSPLPRISSLMWRASPRTGAVTATSKTLPGYGWLWPAGDLCQRWTALGNPRPYIETSVEGRGRWCVPRSLLFTGPH